MNLLWRDAVQGLTAYNITNLHPLGAGSAVPAGLTRDIAEYVIGTMEQLPLYFNFPMKLFAFFINCFCLITAGRKLGSIPAQKRDGTFRLLIKIPFFGTLNKFVRATAFMRFFDHQELFSDDDQAQNIRSPN